MAAPERKVQPRHRAPNFNIQPDDEAQVAWRSHQPAVVNVGIPEELVLQGFQYVAIARSHRAFISPASAQSVAGSVAFGIWGKSECATAAKRAIVQLIKESQSSAPAARPSGAKWTKMVSLTPILREKAEKRWKKDVIRQKFRQHPPHGTAFGAIGSFHWPPAEHRPEDILGMSFEALDPIRMECKCYIIFDKPCNVFRVFGKTPNVREALLRVRRTYFQIAAKQALAVRRHLIHLEERDVPSHVFLDVYMHPSLDTSEGRQMGQTTSSTLHARLHAPGDRPVSRNPRGEGMERYTDELLSRSNEALRDLRMVILRAMKRLHYYRGFLQLRFRLGTFLPTTYMRPDGDIYTFDEYRDMIEASQFAAVVTQEVGFGEGGLHPCLQHADELLTPHDAMEEQLSLVKPNYSVTFIFEDDSSGDLRLVMSWRETPNITAGTTIFTLHSKRWDRLERDTRSPASLVDITLQDLPHGIAWHIDLQGAHTVHESQLPGAFASFAQQVRIEPKYSRPGQPSSDPTFVIVPTAVTPLKLHSIQQRVVYNYAVSYSDYTLELAYFQDRILTLRSPAGPVASLPRPRGLFEIRSSLQLYRTEWDTMFARNERLPIGACADWDDGGDSWFPPDIGGSNRSDVAPVSPETTSTADIKPTPGKIGFDQLLQKLVRVRRIVETCREEAADTDTDE